MDVIEKITRNGKTLAIHRDEWAENPRDEMECLGTLLCWHRRYGLGGRADKTVSKEFDPSRYSGWEEMEKDIVRRKKPAVILPVFLYDHSGVSMNTTGFSCPWDSGQVGFIYATRREILTYFARRRLTQGVQEVTRKMLQAEVATYAKYANGDVYGYTVTDDETDEVIDSCSGIYTDNLTAVKEAAGWRDA